MSDSKFLEKQPVLLFFKQLSNSVSRRSNELVVVCPSSENPKQILIESYPYYSGKENFDRREWKPENLVEILDKRFVIAFEAKSLAANIRMKLSKAGYRCRFQAFCLSRLFQRIDKSYDIDVHDPLTSYQKLLEIVKNFEIDELNKGF